MSMDDDAPLTEITAALLEWYARARRPLPWRTAPTPYRVWLSEVMLQQTRVEAAKGYFERFLQTYPTVEALAEGDDATLMKLWEGLGYYARARNLKRAARQIAAHGFPATADGWRALPGVGPYTAGAIASIACNEPVPAVDGNVQRVLSRLVGDTLERDAAAALLAPAIPAGRASDFTQAWMEAGEVLCLPGAAPKCLLCPLAKWCRAHREGRVAELPARSARPPRKVQELTVFLLECQGRVALRRRPAKGLLAGLWEFPHADGALAPDDAAEYLRALGAGRPRVTPLPPSTHLFTHLEWRMVNYRATLGRTAEGFTWATPAEIRGGLAIPVAFRALRDLVRSM